ncbi:hypothetical protein R1sor_017510 [Riccia sorocarpa]|uniref:Peroxidase n=1 Tax=Riccia sorocarpa TaxID=122646 RepID=A0ABD3I7E2_9MARC
MASDGTRTFLLFLAVLNLSNLVAGSYPTTLRDNYYQTSCPTAEAVVKKVLTDHFNGVQFGLIAATGIIRLAFHDCHVDGCDASVLLDGPNTEKKAEHNGFLQPTSLDLIDKAKAKLEKVCPGVVSCADIIAYAARDSVVAAGGGSFKVEGGRKDGRVSIASHAQSQLPTGDMTVDALTANFKRKGLTRDQMVILSGSHTFAAGHCHNLVKRLYNFRGTGKTDPSIPPAFAAQLKSFCPKKTFNDTIIFSLDQVDPLSFESGYYKALQQHLGVFTSDQSLYDDTRTRPLVNQLTSNPLFQKKFGDAMRAMGRVGVKTGSNGEIRKNCRHVNPKA